MLSTRTGWDDRGHRVLEDTVLALKEHKRGTCMTPAVGVRQHRKKRRWGSEAGETRLFQEEHPLVKATQVQEAHGSQTLAFASMTTFLLCLGTNQPGETCGYIVL